MYEMIEAHALAALIATPDAPFVVDVCTAEDFAQDPRIVPTSTRIPFDTVTRQSTEKAAGRRQIVVVCQKGLKLSQGVAARLCAEGVDAAALAQGVQGWHAAGLPATPWGELPENGLWVMSSDRAAEAALAHWLLTRFAPPGHRLLSVDPSQAQAVAERFMARQVGSATALRTSLGLETDAIAALCTQALAPAGPPVTLAVLLDTAARDPRSGTPAAPALALLDLAYAGLRRKAAL